MNTWDKLSMTEKAEIMRLAVSDGIYDLDTIRDVYNKFAEGGHKEDSSWTMEDEAGYREWRNSLPDNLRNTDDNLYDMRGAYKAEMQPTLEADGRYHLQSRDPKTGRILKSPLHPTYLQALTEDARMGYYPTMDSRGNTYTQTWEGNRYDDGGILGFFKSLFGIGSDSDKKQQELTYRGRPAEKKVIVYPSRKDVQVVPKRERPNTSPTKRDSERYENSMRSLVMEHQKVSGGSNPEYDIPFIPEKAILINGNTTSTNVLDSLAKYAGIHNRNPQLSEHPIHQKKYYEGKAPRQINMNEMIGLSTRETKNGAQPYFNQDGDPAYNRIIGNSNYFTAFGYIPADNIVRNFQYNDAGVDRDTPPLLDAFRYYSQGDYNVKKEQHRKEVNKEGEEAWKNPEVKKWWELSGKYWYNNGKGPNK